MKTPLLTFLASLLVFSGFAPWVQAAGDAEAAYKTLVKAPDFSVGGVGVAGVVTESDIACRTLMRAQSPGPLFLRILEEGTPAGKMYALCGLYYKSPETFQQVAGKYRKSQESFEYAAGCMIMKATIQSEMPNLEANRFDGLLKDAPKKP